MKYSTEQSASKLVNDFFYRRDQKRVPKGLLEYYVYSFRLPFMLKRFRLERIISRVLFVVVLQLN